MDTQLEVIELSKTYNNKEAVKNISFKIDRNEIIGILGPNGCGIGLFYFSFLKARIKGTLINMGE